MPREDGSSAPVKARGVLEQIAAAKAMQHPFYMVGLGSALAADVLAAAEWVCLHWPGADRHWSARRQVLPWIWTRWVMRHGLLPCRLAWRPLAQTQRKLTASALWRRTMLAQRAAYKLLAAVAVYHSQPDLLVDRQVKHFIDNASALAGLIKGYPSLHDSAAACTQPRGRTVTRGLSTCARGPMSLTGPRAATLPLRGAVLWERERPACPAWDQHVAWCLSGHNVGRQAAARAFAVQAGGAAPRRRKCPCGP